MEGVVRKDSRRSAELEDEGSGSAAAAAPAATTATSATCSAGPVIPWIAGVNAHHGVAFASTICGSCLINQNDKKSARNRPD